jgi:Ni,Fe-hydrogenase III component G
MRSSDDYKIVPKVEKFLRELADANGFEVIGSYDPEKININEGLFNDGCHPRKKAAQMIFKKCTSISNDRNNTKQCDQ